MTIMTAEARAERETERVRRFYEQAAPNYDRGMQLFDRLLLGGRRTRLCSRARGQTLEVAIGTGRNLALYPPEVQLTGIDLSPSMLALARQRAKALGLDARLVLGDAQALDFPDASFDTLLCTLSLCTIPDERRAVAQAHRVLRPGGQLLLLEHVRSRVAPVWWVEQLVEPLARLATDHLLRDPLDHLEAAGFAIERCERSRWGVIEEVVARKW